jgi:beta-lactamase class A
MFKRYFFIIISVAIISFLLGGFLVWLKYRNTLSVCEQEISRGEILRLNDKEYQLINPLLACDVGREEAFPEFKPLKDSLEKLTKQEVNNGNASEVSIYLRSLMVGRWFQINSDKTYTPASLIKIIVAMAYYKEVEDNSSILQKQIIFKGTGGNADSGIPGDAIPQLTDGKSYSVSELIDQMIIYSDNDAMLILLDNFDSETLEILKDIHSELNIPFLPSTEETKIQNAGGLDFMSVNNYSMVFRVLFSATYLNRDNSEKILNLLTEANYKNGIVASIPSNIFVAHKFGVRIMPDTSSSEFHDCGIVYYPEHPYLLCIMTKGNDINNLQKTIRNISDITYKWLDDYFSRQ